MTNRTRSRTNEMKTPWNKKEKHPSELRVGDAPKPTGVDYAMSMVRKAVTMEKWLEPESEEIIMKHPKAAYYYAAKVLRDRWIEAEPTIRQDPDWWKKYKKFVKSLPKEKQSYVTESTNRKTVLKESTQVKKRLLGELVPLLNEMKDIKYKLESKDVIRRMKSVGQHKESLYEELCNTVNSSIKQIESIVFELLEEVEDLA